MRMGDWYYVSMWNTKPRNGPGMFPHHVQGWGKAVELRRELNGELSQEARERGVHWDIQNAPPGSRPVKTKKPGRPGRQSPPDRRNRR